MNLTSKPIGSLITVNLIPDSFTFLSDSQDVRAVYESLGVEPEYDALFVQVLDGEYGQVWGMNGIVPDLSKLVRRIH